MASQKNEGGPPAGGGTGESDFGELRIVVECAETDRDITQSAVERLVAAGAHVVWSAGAKSETSLALERRGGGCDLALLVRANAVERSRQADFALMEGEVTATLRNNVSGEVVATATGRAEGRRTSVPGLAARFAKEAAGAVAVDRLIEQVRARSGTLLVREAAIVNVFSEGALLAIMEHLARLEGVWSVRRLEFDRRTNEARILLVGDASIEPFWRAHLEKLPKTVIGETTDTESAGSRGFPNWHPAAHTD